MGRSSQNDVVHWIPAGYATVIQVEEDYTAPQLFDPYPQSQLHTQWPGVSSRRCQQLLRLAIKTNICLPERD